MLTLTIPAGALTDQYGVPSAGFTGTYITDIVSEPYPIPLTQQAAGGQPDLRPVGQRRPSDAAGNTDTYTLPLAAGQTLSLVLVTDPSLIGTVTLVGPDGTTIGSATGAGAGATVVLESAPIATAGTYSLIVGGSGGTTGNYTLQAILNAAYKPATGTNNSIASAYDLSSAFTSLGTTPYADRAGVLGTIDSSGDTDFYKFWLNQGQSTTLDATGLNGNIGLGLYDASGDLLALPSGATYAGPVDLSGGFSNALGQLTLNGNANISGSDLDLTDGGYGEAGSAFTTNAIDTASFRPASISRLRKPTPTRSPTGSPSRSRGTIPRPWAVAAAASATTRSATASASSSTIITMPEKEPIRRDCSRTVRILTYRRSTCRAPV